MLAVCIGQSMIADVAYGSLYRDYCRALPLGGLHRLQSSVCPSVLYMSLNLKQNDIESREVLRSKGRRSRSRGQYIFVCLCLSLGPITSDLCHGISTLLPSLFPSFALALPYLPSMLTSGPPHHCVPTASSFTAHPANIASKQ